METEVHSKPVAPFREPPAREVAVALPKCRAQGPGNQGQIAYSAAFNWNPRATMSAGRTG